MSAAGKFASLISRKQRQKAQTATSNFDGNHDHKEPTQFADEKLADLTAAENEKLSRHLYRGIPWQKNARFGCGHACNTSRGMTLLVTEA